MSPVSKLLAASCAALLATVLPAGASPPEKLSIERLYSLPNLIGTAPSGFAWSGDGRHLAFLWNDEGHLKNTEP